MGTLLQCFFFTRENEKCTRVFWQFFWFSWAEKKILAHFFKIFLGQFEIYSDTFSYFSRVDFFFSGRIVLAGVKILNELISSFLLNCNGQ